MRAHLTLLAVFTACSGGEEQPPADGLPPPVIDASVDATPPRCNPASPFGPATEMALGLPPDDIDVRFSPDALTAVFSHWVPSTDWDLWTASRESVDDDFGPGALVAATDTSDYELQPTISADGLELYFVRYPPYEARVATRALTSEPFGADVRVAEIGGRTGLYLLPNHKMYASSSVSAEVVLQVFGWNGTQFVGPSNVAGVDLPGDDRTDVRPVVTPDELTLYYASKRPGGLGDYDLWVATRPTAEALFGPSTNLTSLNTERREDPNWVSSDGCELYFTRSIDVTHHVLMRAMRGP